MRGIDRRGFLASIAAAFVCDPERLLWEPGKKLISIPPAMPVGRVQFYTPGKYAVIDAGFLEFHVDSGTLDFEVVNHQNGSVFRWAGSWTQPLDKAKQIL